MITLRRAKERHHDRRRKREVWLTFRPQDRVDPLADGFGTLESLNESRLPPGAGVPRHRYHDAEVLTYVREGALAYEETTGCSGVIHAGEFQRMTVGRGASHSHTNVSRADWAHIFQIWLCSSEAGLEPSHEQRRFSVAERRGILCVIASPDARRQSLRIHQDALMYSSVLEPGQHVVHELAQGRSAWLHLVHGEVSFGDVVLATGDGAGVRTEPAVSFTAREETEILLFNLREESPRSAQDRGVA